MVRNSRQHWTSLLRLALAKRTIDSTKPWLRRGNSCTLVCISLPWCFFWSAWWCVDTEDDQDENIAKRTSAIQAWPVTSTDFLVEPFTITIVYVDPNIAGNRVSENNTQLISWHWSEDDELILLIVTSIVDMTIWSVVNAAIDGLPDPRWNIRELWGCQEGPDGHGSPYPCNVTPIFDNKTAAGWVQAALK